jgi:hypothetical protein
MQIIHVSEFNPPSIFIDTVDQCAHHRPEVLRVLVALVRERDRLRLLLVVLLVVHPQLIVQLLQSLLPLRLLHFVGLLDFNQVRGQEVVRARLLLEEVRVVRYFL